MPSIRFQAWQEGIEQAASVDQLLKSMRLYMAAWTPEQLAVLPSKDLAATALPSTDAIYARAYMASRAEFGFGGEEPGYQALREMALTFSAAATRLRVLEAYRRLGDERASDGDCETASELLGRIRKRARQENPGQHEAPASAWRRRPGGIAYKEWRASIEMAPDVDHLVQLVRAYLSGWKAAELRHLPQELAATSPVNSADIIARAVFASRLELGFEGNEHDRRLLREMSLTLAAAANRLQLLQKLARSA